MKNKRGLVAAFLFLVVFLGGYLIRYVCSDRTPAPYQMSQGLIFGTTYKMIYQYERDLQPEIEAELKSFDASLSPFNEQSVIARVNGNDSQVVVDEWFTKVFNKSQEVWRLTGGAFDPTVSPLINLWGFGFKKKDEQITQQEVDSLLRLVGMDKVSLKKGKVSKQDERMTLDFSAIAKGFACDVMGEFFKKKGVRNFMVEIGGEVTTSGLNANSRAWRIGINLPEDSAHVDSFQYKEVLSLSGKGMATSGNYRNFYYKDGKRVAHTIDPKSGYPIEHTLLSATVVADDCMTADAFATAFMVLGLERSMQLAESIPSLDVYFIFDAGNDLYDVAMSPGMRRYISE